MAVTAAHLPRDPGLAGPSSLRAEFFRVFNLRSIGWVLGLCVLFVVANAGLTALSLQLGPQAFGYGFALSLLLCVTVGFVALARSFARLEYSTFMLQ